MPNEELHKLYSSSYIIMTIMMRWEEHVARMEEIRDEYKILVGNTEIKIPPGRPRRKWED